jgi:hypothetical protein
MIELKNVMTEAPPGEWMLQPTLNKKALGFISSEKELNLRLKKSPEDVKTAKDTIDKVVKSHFRANPSISGKR